MENFIIGGGQLDRLGLRDVRYQRVCAAGNLVGIGELIAVGVSLERIRFVLEDFIGGEFLQIGFFDFSARGLDAFERIWQKIVEEIAGALVMLDVIASFPND